MYVVTTRHVLMIEVEGDPRRVAARLEELVPDLQVFGEVDPIDAALLVVKRDLADAQNVMAYCDVMYARTSVRSPLDNTLP